MTVSKNPWVKPTVGLLAGLAITSVAFASPASASEANTAPVADATQQTTLTPEQEAIWAKFDTCLTDKGIDLDAVFGDGGKLDSTGDAKVDAAFAECDKILDALQVDSEPDQGPVEMSAEDKAAFDKFDKCIAAEGITDEVLASEGEDTPQITAKIDAAFEKCEDHLGDLADLDIDDSEIEMFEKFDSCVTAEGITDEVLASEGENTPQITARIEAAFEKCDSVFND